MITLFETVLKADEVRVGDDSPLLREKQKLIQNLYLGNCKLELGLGAGNEFREDDWAFCVVGVLHRDSPLLFRKPKICSPDK